MAGLHVAANLLAFQRILRFQIFQDKGQWVTGMRLTNATCKPLLGRWRRTRFRAGHPVVSTTGVTLVTTSCLSDGSGLKNVFIHSLAFGTQREAVQFPQNRFRDTLPVPSIEEKSQELCRLPKNA